MCTGVNVNKEEDQQINICTQQLKQGAVNKERSAN
jgi:hypothetical protein